MQSFQKACKALDIDSSSTKNLSLLTVRKQYKLMALKYHPDKNKALNAHSKYQEIKEAHDYLLLHVDNPQANCNDNGGTMNSWASSVSSFFETLYNNQTLQKRVFHPLLMRIIETCETEVFEKMDARRATKIYDILMKYKDCLHLSEDFLNTVCEIIRRKNAAPNETIVLNPNMDDLLNQSVYKLKISEDNVCFVPLWHGELIYDKLGIVVQCEPELPDNVELDEDNNIHLSLEYKMLEIWGKDTLEYLLGTSTRTFCLDDLKIKREQTILKRGEGIPLANKTVIFSVDALSDVYLHIAIT